MSFWALLIGEIREHPVFYVGVAGLFASILTMYALLYMVGPRFLAAYERRKAKAMAKALAKRHRARHQLSGRPREP